ncbi:MAG TPA: GNAT family N-acetyltransferase [Trueperaceae bacterium]
MSTQRDGGDGAQLASPGVATRAADVQDAPLVHAIYLGTPGYFDIISIPVPTLAEVETDLATAARDARRQVELVYAPPDLQLPGWELVDGVGGRPIVGYLDYKLDYPEPGDATVNLLLVHGQLQSRGVGKECARDLESRLRVRGNVRRMLASIYGQNPRAERFWRSLGYTFAIDAKPILDWYAKEL